MYLYHSFLIHSSAVTFQSTLRLWQALVSQNLVRSGRRAGTWEPEFFTGDHPPPSSALLFITHNPCSVPRRVIQTLKASLDPLQAQNLWRPHSLPGAIKPGSLPPRNRWKCQGPGFSWRCWISQRKYREILWALPVVDIG